MRPALRTALLLIVTALVYAPTLTYGFVYEDFNDLPLLLEPLTPLLATHNPARRLTQLSYAVSAWLTPNDPLGYHAVNVGLHLLNVSLVLALARAVFAPGPALLAAAVFALHPIQVEAVAYVSARADLLATTGVLLALLATSRGLLPGVVAGLAVACLAKETAIVAWALVPLWAAWTRVAFPFRWWLAAAFLVPVGLMAYGPQIYRLVPVVDLPSLARTAAAVWRLIALVIVPVGFTVDHDWSGIATWITVVALVALVGLAVWATTIGWARRNWIAFASIWTLVALSPRFVIPLVEGLHEHHFLMPSIAWCLCAGAGLHMVTRMGVKDGYG